MADVTELPLEKAARLLREIRFIYEQETKRAAERIEEEGIPEIEEEGIPEIEDMIPGIPPEDARMLTALNRVPKNTLQILVILVREVAQLEYRVAELEAALDDGIEEEGSGESDT